MTNDIQMTNLNKSFFKLKEGSNYKVLMTYDRQEIIEYTHFLKIVKVLNDSLVQFLTINDRVTNKSTIIDISPTNERTNQQKKQEEVARGEVQRKERRRVELENMRVAFTANYFDSLHGVGNWTLWCFDHKQDHPKVVTQKDLDDCKNAFSTLYPAEANEIKSYQ